MSIKVILISRLYGNGLAARLREGANSCALNLAISFGIGRAMPWRMRVEAKENEHAWSLLVQASRHAARAHLDPFCLDFDLPSFLFSIRSLDTSFFFLTHFWLGM